MRSFDAKRRLTPGGAALGAACRVVFDRIAGVARVVVLFAAGTALVGCAPFVKRDLSAVPAGQVGFDDLCGVQDYFDDIAAGLDKPPRLVSGIEPEDRTGKVRGGRARFAFETEKQLAAVRRVLNQNFDRLPADTATATRIDVEVVWAARAGVRRVVMDRDAELTVDRRSTRLPTHVCLSELLFGQPLYRQRHLMMQPPSATPEPGVATGGGTATGAAPAMETPAPAPAPDGGVTDAWPSNRG